MPNKIKVSSSKIANAIGKGNLKIGTGTGTEYGPTKTGFVIPAVNVDSTQTLWWQGVDPPTNGYAVYTLIGDAFKVVLANNDSELETYINAEFGQNVSGATGALNYIAGQTAVFVLNKEFPSIVTDSLSALYSPDFTVSYPKGGTSVFDLAGSGTTATLSTGASYGATSFGGGTAGIFILDGLTGIISMPCNVNYYGGKTSGIAGSATWSCWHRILTAGTAGSENIIFWFQKPDGNSSFKFSYDGATTNTSLLGSIVSANGTYNTGVGSATGGWPNKGPLRNTWTQTTITFSGSNTLKLYFNGSLCWTSGSYFMQMNIFSGPLAPLYIGGGQSGRNLVEEQIGDIFVYRKELSAAEVLQNYNATKSKYGL